MPPLPSPQHLMLFVIVYAVSLAIVLLINQRDFKRDPEKGRRCAALPLPYKLAFLLVVLPLFAATVLQPAMFFAAAVAFMLLEAACTRWYRRAGLLG